MHIYGALRAEFEHEVNEPAFRSPKALCRRTKENTNAQRFIFMLREPSMAESVAEDHLNAFRLEVCNDLSSAEDSAGSAHVKLHELYHPAHLQVVPSAVKGQPFAYQSNLPLHRACIHPSMFVHCQRSALCLSEQPSSSQGLHSPKHVCPLSKVSPLPIRATFLFTGPAQLFSIAKRLF